MKNAHIIKSLTAHNFPCAEIGDEIHVHHPYLGWCAMDEFYATGLCYRLDKYKGQTAKYVALYRFCLDEPDVRQLNMTKKKVTKKKAPARKATSKKKTI